MAQQVRTQDKLILNNVFPRVDTRVRGIYAAGGQPVRYVWVVDAQGVGKCAYDLGYYELRVNNDTISVPSTATSASVVYASTLKHGDGSTADNPSVTGHSLSFGVNTSTSPVTHTNTLVQAVSGLSIAWSVIQQAASYTCGFYADAACTIPLSEIRINPATGATIYVKALIDAWYPASWSLSAGLLPSGVSVTISPQSGSGSAQVSLTTDGVIPYSGNSRLNLISGNASAQLKIYTINT